MIVAVGMYLDFATSSAIFVGGVIRWIADRMMARRGMDAQEIDFRVNVGTLLASGMIAGEALIAIVLAILVNLNVQLPQFGGSGTLGMVVFGVVALTLIAIPMRATREAGA